MNETVKEILRVLEEGKPELQVAAAQILGELRPKDPAVVKALEMRLYQGDERILGRYVIGAVAKIGTQDAVQVLVGRLGEGDLLSDQVTHLLAEMGADSHKALAGLFEEAGPELQARILGIFSRQFSREGLEVLLGCLLDPALSDPATEALLSHAGRLSPAQQKTVTTRLSKALGDKRIEVSEECLTRILRVLGRLSGQDARSLLVRFTGDKQPPAVREAALRALAGVQLTPTQVRNFLGMLKEPEEKALHDAIRDLLVTVEDWPDGSVVTLKNLVASRSPEQRLFALRALRSCHTPEVAKIAMRYLDHNDPRYREAAEAALSENKHAVSHLLRAMQGEKDIGRARRLAGLLVELREHFPDKQLKAQVEKACRLLTAGDPLGDVLFELLLKVDGAKTASLVTDKAMRLRRARRLAESVTILARTAQTPNLSDEGRYQLAVARLLLDVENRTFDNGGHGDPTMGFLAALVRGGFPVLDRLKKESMIPPEAMLRVGTHFAESVGPERRFGTEMLQHLANRNKGRAAEEARLVLRAEGL